MNKLNGSLYLIILITVALLVLSTKVEKIKSDFSVRINGLPANVDSLYISEAYFAQEYESSTISSESSLVKDGMCHFKGTLKNPVAVRIYSLTDSFPFNEIVFIQSGDQQLSISIENKEVIIHKRPQTKIEREYKKFLAYCSIKNLDEEISPEALFNYAIEEPSSYVLLYAIINQTFNYHYDPKFRAIAKNLSNGIKKSKPFIYYKSQYLLNRSTPAKYLVSDSSGKKINIAGVASSSDFTIIELWFSGCGGCIQKMKKIDSMGGFFPMNVKIINLNTDSRLNFERSKLFYNKLELKADCYYDFSAGEIGKFFKIEKYPSNIVLNKNGNIIARDIDIFNTNYNLLIEK